MSGVKEVRNFIRGVDETDVVKEHCLKDISNLSFMQPKSLY